MSKQPPAGQSQNAQPTTEKAGARVVLWLLFALAVLFGGLYAGAHFAAGDKVPKGTTVSGVKIGGHPQTKAAAVLQAGLADRVNRPIELAIEGQQDSDGPVKVDPVAAGLSVDYEASVAEAGGQRSWDPVRLWNYFTGGEKLAAVIDVDESAYNAELTRLQEQYGTAARDAAIRFDGADIVKTEPVSGRAFDPADTLTALQAAFLAPAPVPAALTLSTQVPQIDAADMQEALDAFASPVVAAPITLEFDGRTIELAPDEFTSALSLKAVDGELVPTLNKSKLTKVMSGVVSQGAPVDATVALVAGKPQVVAAKDGVVFVKSQLEDGFLDLVSAPEGERNLALDSEVAQPEFSTADAEALRIHERVSTFTTYYPHADYRNINLGRAGELIDGTVLKPGETFSLNGTVGERTVANGFTEGYIIADGILIQDLGGGVSQMATTWVWLVLSRLSRSGRSTTSGCATWGGVPRSRSTRESSRRKSVGVTTPSSTLGTRSAAVSVARRVSGKLVTTNTWCGERSTTRTCSCSWNRRGMLRTASACSRGATSSNNRKGRPSCSARRRQTSRSSAQPCSTRKLPRRR